MLRLNLLNTPGWLDLGHGVRVFVEPMSTAVMIAARRDPQIRATSAEPRRQLRFYSNLTVILMRILDTTSAAYLAARSGVASRHMIYILARNRETGAQEALGLWQGDDHLTLAVGEVNRTYYGAGSLIGVAPIRAGIGLEVRMLQIALSPLTPEVAQLLRGYDARLAPAEVHRGLLSLETGQLIAAPIRLFRGWVDEVKLKSGEVGGASEATVTLASAARGLTRALTLTRSDAEMRRRSAGDRFRDYTDIAGEVGVWWGEKRERA